MARYTSLPDTQLGLFTVITCVVVYFSVLWLSNTPQVPILTTVFIGSNMFSRSKLFQSIILPRISRLLEIPFKAASVSIPTTIPSEDRAFNALGEASKLELLSAIKSLQGYAQNSKKQNDRRRRLFKLMTWRQQRICEDVGYLSKLKQVDLAFFTNQKFLGDIASHCIDTFNVTYTDYDLLKDSGTNTSSSNYRVVESLGHFVRDWTTQGEQETKSMLTYITSQLNSAIPEDQRHKTCIIVPGSGLGRVAHELALLGDFGAVHAVEYSGLMHSCHSFMYTEKQPSYEVYPAIHSCSNFKDNATQFRTVEVNVATKPENLHLHLDDFRYFALPTAYENVVVVSAFFIDTAENLMDYFDAIKTLTTPSRTNGVKSGYWINAGPLKYGSAAQVELNADEIAQIRKKMGWKDMDTTNSLENEDVDKRLVGYVTDQASMWQGFYGLAMWSSARKENS